MNFIDFANDVNEYDRFNEEIFYEKTIEHSPERSFILEGI